MKTIYPAKLPLPEMISRRRHRGGHSDDAALRKTDQRDEHGRTVYVERN